MFKSQIPIDENLLFGKTDRHLVKFGDYQIHSEIVDSFKELQKAAAVVGFDLRINSSFRSYDQQLQIWKNKCAGKRDLWNQTGTEKLEYHSLTPIMLLKTIMRWSAIPGASRHHWGTDMDIYDHNALPSPDYKIEMIPEEVNDNGIFGPLHRWLDERIEDGESFGFFRPYSQDKGGIAPERWHMSFAPLSQIYQKTYTLDLFVKNVETTDMPLKDLILKESEFYYQKYFMVDYKK